MKETRKEGETETERGREGEREGGREGENMKSDTWNWARSYSMVELNVFLELKKLTTNVDAEMEW